MAQLVFLLTIFFSASGFGDSLRLDFFAETSLPAGSKIMSQKVGGLSGLFWNGQHLLAVSDDRGKFGGGRVYEMDLRIKSEKVELIPVKSIAINGTGKEPLDLEGLGILPDGSMLLTSEGDNNAKPRSLPRIFITNALGVHKSDIALPDRFVPERLGEQKKGIENNRGFEALTVSADGTQIYAMSETPIISDQPEGENSSLWLRLIHFSKEKGTYKFVEELPYLISTPTETDLGPELFRGVSEMLFWKEKKFLVLERGARFGTKGIRYTGGIYMADFQGTKDVSKISKLPSAKLSSPLKDKLVDLESLMISEKPGRDKLENFEGLAWGPNLPDGRKTLLVISDDNFSPREKTQLLVFTVKEVE